MESQTSMESMFSFKNLEEALDDAWKGEHQVKMSSTLTMIERIGRINDAIAVICPCPDVKRVRKIGGKLYLEVWPQENVHVLFLLEFSGELEEECVEKDQLLCQHTLPCDHRCNVSSVTGLHRVGLSNNLFKKVVKDPSMTSVVEKGERSFLKFKVGGSMILQCLHSPEHVVMGNCNYFMNILLLADIVSRR